jgi:hypothetical protein
MKQFFFNALLDELGFEVTGLQVGSVQAERWEHHIGLWFYAP